MADTPERKRIRLRPIADAHREASRRFILEEAHSVRPGSAIVLGAGGCDEIPLAELVARFDFVLLNDLDAANVEAAVDAYQLDDAARAKVEVVATDLTGMADNIVAAVHEAVVAASNAGEAVEQMSAALDGVTINEPPIAGQFDLVIASCVLGQLHVMAMHRAQAVFHERFADHGSLLQSSPNWSQSVARMARRMEAAFIDSLAKWVTPEGRIYLSETVRVAFIEPAEDGGWETQGTFSMLKSANLADYLDGRFRIESQRKWLWVFNPPQKPGDRGRLFEVQAVVLSPA